MQAVAPVANKIEIFDRIRSIFPKLSERGVERVGVFGSFVRGEQRDESDVDLLVTFDGSKKTLANFVEAADLLEESMGRKVEVVTPESLSRHIGPHILREVEYVEVEH